MALNVKSLGGTAQRGDAPDCVVRFFEVTADNAYPAGGYSLPPATLGLSEVLFVQAEASTDGAKAVYNHATNKLMFYVTGASGGSKFSESAAGGVNGSVARVIVFGR